MLFSDSGSPESADQRLYKIAADIFQQQGIDLRQARRAGGWTNATWIANGVVLRLSVRQNNSAILREAQLSSLLPPSIGYPEIIAVGKTEGYEWSLSKEITGQCLGEVWPSLDWDQRITALQQLWEKAQAVHSVDVDAAQQLARDAPWYNATRPAEAQTSTSRLVQQKLFTPRQGSVLSGILTRFWQALPFAPAVLNHGDLTLDNAMWDQGQVVALLDFEFAVMAPVELDINSVVKLAFGPTGLEDYQPERDNTGRQRLQACASALVLPVLVQPNAADLLLGYAVLLEQWLLETWLAHPEGEGPLEHWEPYRRLLSLADGQGGYLTPLLRQVNTTSR